MSDDITMECRAEASHQGLRAAMNWIEWCKNNGWPETSLRNLETLWWQYHDKEGNLKSETKTK